MPSHIIIFVEGDTDEVFFKALIEYYKQVSSSPILPCSICNLKGVTRYSSKLLAKLKNEYIPEARNKRYCIKTICCSYDTDVFEIKNPLMVDWSSLAKSVKRLGIDGFSKLSDLYAKARRTYQKGYATRELIGALDFGRIVKARKEALAPLEATLGVTK